MRLAALLAVLALGCSAAPGYRPSDHPQGTHSPFRFYLNPQADVTLDPAFTPDEAAAIEAGFDGFTEATNGCVAPRLVTSGGFPVRREDVSVNTYGRTSWSLLDPHISLDPGRTDEAASRTAAHELGHIMGLDHIDTDPSCLMFPSNTGRLEFCEAEIRRITRLWGCQ